jgi:hypothetical protein
MLNLLTVASVELAGGIALTLGSRTANTQPLNTTANTTEQPAANAPADTETEQCSNTESTRRPNTSKTLKNKRKQRSRTPGPNATARTGNNNTFERLKREIVASLLDGPKSCSQRILADTYGCSVSTVNKAVQALADAGIVSVRANRSCTHLELARESDTTCVTH